MNILDRILYRSSGADAELVAICPSTERSRFKIIGIVNLTEILLFGISAFVFISSYNKLTWLGLVVSVLLTLLFSVMFYYLNRLTLKSIAKDEQLLYQLISMTPKLIISIFLAIGIANTLEIYFFWDTFTEPGQNLFNTELNYLDYLERLDGYQSSNDTKQFLGWLLYGFLVLLFTTPILMRVFSEKGIYDFLIEEKEKRVIYDQIQDTENTKTRFRRRAGDPTAPPELDIQDLKEKVARDRLKEAVELVMLKLNKQAPLFNNFILLQAKLNSVEREKNMGVLKEDTYFIEKTKIQQTMLDLLDQLEDG